MEVLDPTGDSCRFANLQWGPFCAKAQSAIFLKDSQGNFHEEKSILNKSVVFLINKLTYRRCDLRS